MILEAIILGILQGILEWLPISSQGNLFLIMVYFFGLKAEPEQAFSFSVLLHFGTLFAVIIYLRKEVLSLLKALPSYRFDYSNRENRLISFLFLTTIITGAIGYPLYRFVQATVSVGEAFIAIVGIALIVTGLIQKYSKTQGKRGTSDPNLKDTLLLGVAQGFSIIPGISRSGITTSSLLFRKFGGGEALKLSFLMSIPAVLIAEIGLVVLKGIPAMGIEDLILGNIFSFAFGLLSIHILMKIAKKFKFWAFCIILGILALLPLLGYV